MWTIENLASLLRSSISFKIYNKFQNLCMRMEHKYLINNGYLLHDTILKYWVKYTVKKITTLVFFFCFYVAVRKFEITSMALAMLLSHWQRTQYSIRGEGMTKNRAQWEHSVLVCLLQEHEPHARKNSVH